jgi:hypothetical protein
LGASVFSVVLVAWEGDPGRGDQAYRGQEAAIRAAGRKLHQPTPPLGRAIQRDYQELKSELWLHHYEGRSWRGFHHHASLSIAAYGFLISERLRSDKNSARLKAPAVPNGSKTNIRRHALFDTDH